MMVAGEAPEQLSLDLEVEPLRSPDVDSDDGCEVGDRDWERCLWLEEILGSDDLPTDFAFGGIVVCLEEGVYLAIGSNPHEWQEFVWMEDGGWELGASDLGVSWPSRVDSTEFQFILRELRRKEALPLPIVRVMREAEALGIG